MEHTLNFKNKIVLITGAARGIGRETAFAFANEGAQIAINYNTSEKEAKNTLDQLPGGPHTLVHANIADPQAVQTMIDKVVVQFGRIDVLVNNAALYQKHDVNEVTYEDWQKAWTRILGVNLIGSANVTYCAVQQMMKQGSGKIINVSSRGAFRGEPSQPAYGASKAGLNSMGQSLAKALAPHNIFVATVAPGFVDTEMAASILSGPDGDAVRAQSPLGRVAKPVEVATAILNLSREGMEFTTGCILDVNGASYLRT